MEIFPRKELSSDISESLFQAYMENFTPALPKEMMRFLSGPPAEQPAFPAAEERMEALATIWSEARYNFAYWDLTPGEAWWNQQLRTYLPRVAAAATEEEYWRLLGEFTNLLGDGHTGIINPWHLRQTVAEPPVRLLAVEGRPIVMEADALPRGAEILTVDGTPVAEVLASRKPQISSSTPHWTETLLVERLLRGPEGSRVVVTCRLPDGAVVEKALLRQGKLPEPPCLEVTDLGAGIRHVAINSMGTFETADLFDQAFPDFEGVRGLILDVRQNGGGHSGVGHRILSRVLLEPTLGAATRIPLYAATLRAWGAEQRWLYSPADPVQPDATKPRFAGPVVALSSARSFSAAEDFLVAWKQSRRGPLVGGPSGGSTGQPLMVLLPGGGAVRICTKRDTFADGSLFVGSGVQPDVLCYPTAAGIAAGRDEVLERALECLK